MKTIFLQVLSLIAIFFAILTTFIPAIIIAKILPKKYRKRIIVTTWRIFSRLLLSKICLSKIIEEDRRKTGTLEDTAVFICNHQSMMDIPLVAMHVQESPLMKHELSRIPILGIATRYADCILVKRSDMKSRKEAFLECVRRIERKQSIIYFPEGTRSKTDYPKPIEKIKTRIMEKAYDLNFPVVPMSVQGTQKLLSKKNRLNFFQHIGIILHPLVMPDNYETKEEFIKACWEQVIIGHQELNDRLPQK